MRSQRDICAELDELKRLIKSGSLHRDAESCAGEYWDALMWVLGKQEHSPSCDVRLFDEAATTGG